MPIVRGMEAQAPAAARGQGEEWQRWIEVRLLSGDIVYGFRAEGRALTRARGALRTRAEILSPGFDPLCAEHTLCRDGTEYSTSGPAPAELRRIAVDACRVVALRLHAFGVDRGAVAQPWPKVRPSFASIVAGEPIWAQGAEVRPYGPRRGARRAPQGGLPITALAAP
jgi:hypothetical protein